MALWFWLFFFFNKTFLLIFYFVSVFLEVSLVQALWPYVSWSWDSCLARRQAPLPAETPAQLWIFRTTCLSTSTLLSLWRRFRLCLLRSVVDIQVEIHWKLCLVDPPALSFSECILCGWCSALSSKTKYQDLRFDLCYKGECRLNNCLPWIAAYVYSGFSCLFLFFVFFETGFLCLALAALELTL